MSSCKYFNFVRVIIISSFFLQGCSFLSANHSEEKAYEVARIACGSFHSSEIETPHNTKAILTTFEEANKMAGSDINQPFMPADSKVWFVQLTGKWQVDGPPPSIDSNLPVPSPELWNTCEVIIDPDEWHAFYTHQFGKETTP